MTRAELLNSMESLLKVTKKLLEERRILEVKNYSAPAIMFGVENLLHNINPNRLKLYKNTPFIFVYIYQRRKRYFVPSHTISSWRRAGEVEGWESW